MRTGKLTALEVARAIKARKVGLLNDGAGLYLKDGSSWIYRYPVVATGKKRDLGLGSAHDVTLAEARRKAGDARRLRLEGKDPFDERRASRALRAPAITFAEVATEYIAAHAPGWRSEKHLRQWESSLARFVFPIIGGLPVVAIGVADVLHVLTPVWMATPETARRIRNRIELVLDAAKARGLRSGENPAQWRGHLDKLLPRTSKVGAVKHFAAISDREIVPFMTKLRALTGPAPAALEFVILTATRSGETLGALWDEIDLAAKVWTVPPERTKARREHRVPLSDAALAVLAKMAAIKMNPFIFPGQRGPLSAVMLQETLKRLGRRDITVHGFRSCFRDWTGNETAFPREVAEAALAHAVGDETERAYRRGDALAKRRALMDAWARHCERRESEQVVALRSV